MRMKKAFLFFAEGQLKFDHHTETLCKKTSNADWFYEIGSNFEYTENTRCFFGKFTNSTVEFSIDEGRADHILNKEGEAQMFHVDLEATDLDPEEFADFIIKNWRRYTEDELEKWLKE